MAADLPVIPHLEYCADAWEAYLLAILCKYLDVSSLATASSDIIPHVSANLLPWLPHISIFLTWTLWHTCQLLRTLNLRVFSLIPLQAECNGEQNWRERGLRMEAICPYA
jgi:hypothetical protein